MNIRLFCIAVFISSHLSALHANVLWIDERSVDDAVKINSSTFNLIKPYLSSQIAIERASTRRALKIMENDNRVSCRGNLKKTPERAAKYAFTALPQLVFQGVALFSHKPLLTKQTIDFFEDSTPNFSLAIEQGRSYGFDVSQLANENTQIVTVHPSQSAKTLIEMFKLERFDALIEYPSVINHYISDQMKAKIHSYQIKQASSGSLGYIACTNSDAGRAFVEQLNAALKIVSQQRAYFDAQMKWGSYAQTIELYNEVYGTDFSINQR